ncbi:MAG: hypothetical protein RAO94_12695, partial [Candidatus Stygibacter australis]|nr:hypothetical protein [Candidatus Stygibacter australis]
MKRSLICFIIFIAFGITLFADTIIQDSTNVYGTWSYENSPYIVEGEAIVPEDSTLVIEPGVTVKFQIGPSQNHNNSNGHLIVNGKLEAIGTESDSIRFTRNDSIGYWGIIYFSETSDSTSVISKSIIEYANYNVNFSGPWSQHQGAISFYQSTALIENNLIMNNNKNGICIFGEE